MCYRSCGYDLWPCTKDANISSMVAILFWSCYQDIKVLYVVYRHTLVAKNAVGAAVGIDSAGGIDGVLRLLSFLIKQTMSTSYWTHTKATRRRKESTCFTDGWSTNWSFLMKVGFTATLQDLGLSRCCDVPAGGAIYTLCLGVPCCTCTLWLYVCNGM